MGRSIEHTRTRAYILIEYQLGIFNRRAGLCLTFIDKATSELAFCIYNLKTTRSGNFKGAPFSHISRQLTSWGIDIISPCRIERAIRPLKGRTFYAEPRTDTEPGSDTRLNKLSVALQPQQAVQDLYKSCTKSVQSRYKIPVQNPGTKTPPTKQPPDSVDADFQRIKRPANSTGQTATGCQSTVQGNKVDGISSISTNLNSYISRDKEKEETRKQAAAYKLGKDGY